MWSNMTPFPFWFLAFLPHWKSSLEIHKHAPCLSSPKTRVRLFVHFCDYPIVSWMAHLGTRKQSDLPCPSSWTMFSRQQSLHIFSLVPRSHFICCRSPEVLPCLPLVISNKSVPISRTHVLIEKMRTAFPWCKAWMKSSFWKVLAQYLVQKIQSTIHCTDAH